MGHKLMSRSRSVKEQWSEAAESKENTYVSKHYAAVKDQMLELHLCLESAVLYQTTSLFNETVRRSLASRLLV